MTTTKLNTMQSCFPTMQTEKQRQSSIDAERFYPKSIAFSSELYDKYSIMRTSKNNFASSYKTNSFVLRNI